MNQNRYDHAMGSRSAWVLSAIACTAATWLIAPAATPASPETQTAGHAIERAGAGAACPRGYIRSAGSCRKRIFTAPGGKRRTGESALRAAVRGWLLNASFTTCVKGFPKCPTETRYSLFADLTQRYCRYTSSRLVTAQVDMTEPASAVLNADGSWSADYQDAGDLSHWRWTVTNTGLALGFHWFEEPPAVFNAASSVGSFQWVRGARTCKR